MKIWKIAGFFLLIITCINVFIAAEPKLSDTMQKIKAVKDKIFKGYDKNIRPIKGASNTTEVLARFIPRQILEVDEEKGLFVLDSFIFLIWEDSRLKWNTTEYGSYLQLPQDFFWLPDIRIQNSHSNQVHSVKDALMVATSTGLVYWLPPIHTQTSCPSLLQATYPYGKITCVVQMGSWVYGGWDVKIHHGEELIMHNFLNINPRWELIVSESKVYRNVTYYEGYIGPYFSFNGIFTLRRRTLPEIEATRNPCILVMLLTLSIYWLPTHSSKKIILGGILIMSLVMLLIYVARSTRYPLGTVLDVSFIQSTMYTVATTLLLQILVIFNVCNITGPVRPPPAIMQLLTSPIGNYILLRTSFSGDNIPIDRVQLKEDTPNCIEAPSPSEDWKLFAAALDRLFFCIMSITMIAMHHL